SFQLLPANVSISVSRRRCRFFDFLYKGQTFSTGRVSAPNCLRFLSTLAREQVQHTTESFKRHSSLVFDSCGGRLDSVSSSHSESRRKLFGEIGRRVQ